MSEAALEADRVTVTFGGLRALDGVSLSVPEGSTVGLIGPNGAGKTTFFDCLTGIVRPAEGCVRIFGRDVTGWPVHRRARLGVARTFQRLELFESLTVAENLIVALESRSGAGLAADLFRLSASITGRRRAETRTAEILDLVGLSEHADARAGDLPMGLSRILELARALCTEPRLLLLDEPSSGLDRSESRRLAEVVERIREHGNRSLVIVEHDMAFVLPLSSHVYVLDFGRLIAQGTPAQIRRDPIVQAAYLGEEVEDGTAAGR